MEAVLTREFIWGELTPPPLVVPPRRLRRVLLAIDESAGSRKALEFAATVAGESAGEVIALHVRAREPVKWGPYTLETRLDALQLVLNAVTCLREFGVSRRGLVTSARFNHVGREIAAQAQHLDADLIVMGTRNLSCLAQWLCGSVSRNTSRRAGCPVTLVH